VNVERGEGAAALAQAAVLGEARDRNGVRSCDRPRWVDAWRSAVNLVDAVSYDPARRVEAGEGPSAVRTKAWVTPAASL